MQIHHLKREKSLDILRGIAVMLMIAAHAFAYFHSGDNPILGLVRTFGDMAAFIIFVFVAGATTYFAHLDFPYNNIHEIKFVRIFRLLFDYYLVAYVSAIEDFLKLHINHWPEYFLKILFFMELPDYSEFILTFVLFTLVLYFIQWRLKSIIRSKLKLFIISLLTYTLGYLIYVNVKSFPLGYFTSLLAGFEGLYRFPLLQYFTVLITGIYVGKLIDKDYQYKHKRLILLWLTTIVLLIAFITTLFPELSSFPYDAQFSRWPPSIGFLSIGMSTGLVLITFLTQFKLPEVIERVFTSLGERALGYFTAHIVLYELIDLFFPEFTTYNWMEAIVILIGSITLCHFIINLGEGRAKKTGKPNRTPLRLFAVATGVLFCIFATIAWSFKCSIAPALNCATDSFGGFLADGLMNKDKAIWWDGDYGYSKDVIVLNASIDTLKKGTVITTSFDHSALVTQGKSMADGKDLRLVYFKDGKYIDVVYQIADPNSFTTTLSFKLIEDLNILSRDSNYHLYYGNDLVDTTAASTFSTPYTVQGYSVAFSAEKSNPIESSTSRKWVLLNTKDYSDLNIKIKLNNQDVSIANASYEIEGTTIIDKMERDSRNEFSTGVDVAGLRPGSYIIKSYVVTANGVKLSAPPQQFIVSYPLYVTWSIDWEGLDTSEATLKAMEDFSAKYETPVIQLWNPRAHIVLNQNRLNRLIGWIKDREAKGDEIGLHLHMFTDMVKAAGVNPQNTPNWAAERNKSGSDTPAYVYSYDEHVKIFDWAKAQFASHGLKTPKVYRTGGWMADAALLKALNDTGFVIDTSGRTKFTMGSYKVRANSNDEFNTSIIRKATNEEIQLYLAHKADPGVDISSLPEFVEYEVEGKWDLSATTHPYQISQNNINLDIKPTLSLWEFPNNGADSWHYDTAELRRRFDANFNGDPLKEVQVLTYLSHPHAIQIDIKKLTPTYDYINKFTAKSDQGPVIYSTFKEPYEYITGESY